MTSPLNHVHFDYENGSMMTLVAVLEEGSGQRLIPYQLRMLLENRIPRLLPVSFEEISGKPILRYDITSKRRLIHLLSSEPPNWETWVELAYQLVRTICECSEYMLSEQGYVLSEEHVFAERHALDFKLCYLPVDGGSGKPISDSLRSLLLRTLSLVEGPIDSELKPILGLFSHERYALRHLKKTLGQLRLQERTDQNEPGRPKDIAKKPKLNHPKRKPLWNWNLSKLWPNRKKQTPQALPPAMSVTRMKTEILHRREIQVDAPVLITIHRDGGREERIMEEDRFIIGRSLDGVHYSDPSEGISRIHCEIVKSDNGLLVRDLGSLNGTSLNGVQLIPFKSYPFTAGDVLKAVQTELRTAYGRQSSPLVEQGNTGSY